MSKSCRATATAGTEAGVASMIGVRASGILTLRRLGAGLSIDVAGVSVPIIEFHIIWLSLDSTLSSDMMLAGVRLTSEAHGDH